MLSNWDRLDLPGNYKLIEIETGVLSEEIVELSHDFKTHLVLMLVEDLLLEF